MIEKKLGKKVIEQLKNFPKKPSQWLANKLEDLTGRGYDWSDSDHGEGPKQ